MNLVAKCFLRCWLDISFPPLGLLVFIGTVFTDSDLDHIFPNLLSCYFEFFHRCADLVVCVDSPGGSSGGSELVQKWVDSIETHDTGSVGHVLCLSLAACLPVLSFG